jgi:CheY-like chemotaxis protein
MPAVLIVDDDLDVAEIVRELLEGEGYQVRIAGDGKEGLKQLEAALPDAVLLDIEMPVLDGPGMAYRMFVRDAGMDLVPIVLSSGADYAPAIAREIGTPYMLAKPYQYKALSEVLQRAITERIAPRPTTSL